MSQSGTIDKGMSILIVDDFSTMRRIVKGALGSLGFNNVTEADNGVHALQKLKAQKFDLIVLTHTTHLPQNHHHWQASMH